MPVGPNGERLPYPGEPGGQPLAPMGGGRESFGPGGQPVLGAMGPMPPGADLFGNPSDPSGAVELEAMPNMGGPGAIAEAIMGAVMGQVDQIRASQDAEMSQILDMALMEAEEAIAQVRAAISPEAATLDGPGAIPGDASVGNIGAPAEGVGLEGEGEPEEMVAAGQGMPPEMGAGPVGPTPALLGAGDEMPPGAAGQLPPELLEALMRGA